MYRFSSPLLSVLCLLLAGAVHAGQSGEDLQSQTITVGKLREEITRQEEKIDQSRKQERSLQSELAELDEKIRRLTDKINQLQVKIADQERVIGAKEMELALLNKKTEALRLHLTKRLRTYYFMGKTGFVDFMFTSKTLPELLLNNEAFQSLVSYDQTVFAAYRQSVGEIDRVKRAHELEKTVQENFLAQADEENSSLRELTREKSELLKRVQLEKGLFELSLGEMKRVENELRTLLIRSHRVETGRSRGFIENRGNLPPPVWGTLLRRFQETGSRIDPIFTNGITIQIPDRAEVYAVYDGEVIFAAGMEGYGDTVIIDHGRQYYTVTASLGELLVREGERVVQGQEIGRTGKEARPFGPNLYFEIRHGAVPENPVNWLKNDALSLPRPAPLN